MPTRGDLAATSHAGADSAFRIGHIDASVKDSAIPFRLADWANHRHSAAKGPGGVRIELDGGPGAASRQRNIILIQSNVHTDAGGIDNLGEGIARLEMAAAEGFDVWRRHQAGDRRAQMGLVQALLRPPDLGTPEIG